MICPVCNREVDKIFNIRGRKACLKCQIEFIWDYCEETRRRTEGKETKPFSKGGMSGVRGVNNQPCVTPKPSDSIKILEELFKDTPVEETLDE